MKAFFLIPVIIATAFCGCTEAPQFVFGPEGDACAPGAPIGDAALMHNVGRAALKLMASGKAAPAAQLIKQLSRTQCAVALAQPGKTALSGAEIYSRCGGVLVLASLGRVGNRMSAGAATAFVIAADGVFVTNYHVIDKTGCDAMVAMTREGKVYGVAEILAADKASDCVIGRLDVGADRLTALPLAPAAPVGSDVFVISHPDNHFYYMSRGIVARYSTGRAAGGMEITADYARGSSGGAVLDATGAAVGMVASTYSIYYSKDNAPEKGNLQMVVKYCVPAAAILKLIRRE